MTKNKIYMKVSEQIMKDLVGKLISYKAVFEVNAYKSTLFINDVVAFNFDSERSEPTYRIQLSSSTTSWVDIYIAAGNMEEFTIHFAVT